MNTLDERIAIDPAILAGKPIIKGTRIAVEHILRLLAEGEKEEDILRDFPHLAHEDIIAALRYGAKLVGEEKVYPLEKIEYA